MARHFKMLSASGSLIAIPLDQLSERLKKHGIKCNFFFISGIDGDLGVCEGTGRVCEEFFRPGPFPHSVVAKSVALVPATNKTERVRMAIYETAVSYYFQVQH